MTQWTSDAEKRLSEYLAEVERLARANGDDADDIVDGLMLHIRAEAAGQSGTMVTAEQVQQVLTKLGTPEQIAGRESGPINTAPKASPGENVERPIYSPRKSALVLILGILVPAGALIFEFCLGAMAEMYVDPIPTWWHIAAGAALLGALILVHFFLESPDQQFHKRWSRAAFVLNGYATALAAVYFLIYIPLLPVSVVALLAFGLGIMGFAPMFCLVAGLIQMDALYRLHSQQPLACPLPRRYSIMGVAVVLLLAAVYTGPGIVAARVLPMAISDDPVSRDRGIRQIRTFHLEHQLLKACYAPIVRGIGPSRRWNTDDIAQRDQYRNLYFRVTGVPYNSVPKPEMRVTFRTRPFANSWEDERVADSEVGGTKVAGRVRGVSLRASSMDASVMRLASTKDAPQLAYLEWIVEFENVSESEREARAQIELPHGGVASRLTLWIDGEEREAAFGGRDQVREAYQSVAVVQRRDPALLNVCGPDKVLLQCFPILPNSTMKVKLGITAPLVMRNGKAYLRLPYISERNFTIVPGFEHGVWIECEPGLVATCPVLKSEGDQTLRANVPETELQRGDRAAVQVAALWSNGPLYAGILGAKAATMTMRAVPESTSETSMCLVIDGSAGMGDVQIDWDSIIGAIPPNTVLSAFFASDDIEIFDGHVNSAEFAHWLSTREYEGGCDPVPSLIRACETAGIGGTVLWVHGPLPVELSSVEPLRQWERRRGEASPRILSIEAIPGPNRMLEQCGDLQMLERIPVLESLDETIQFALKYRASGSMIAQFELNESDSAHQIEGMASGHVVRLAVNDAVGRAVRAHQTGALDLLRPLAVETRLVTPLSGAVVLERAEQYAQHGLDPAKNEEAIPGVPEPHEWALMLVVCLVVMFVILKRRAEMRTA
ncbi:MAG: hypothetical protein SGI88_08830 [Candidatus Hydrogenedentes bacterium]|nr:hypothetical protein [Candidatus Hydrogenedentota bacterium]